MRIYWVAAIGLISQAALAADGHDHRDIEQRVEAMVLAEAASLPGRAQVEVTPIDERLRLTPCDALSLQRLGNSNNHAMQTIAVHCKAPEKWQIYVQTKLRMMLAVPVAARSLGARQRISENDIVMVEKDIAGLPPGVLADSSQIIGQELASNVMAGLPLRKDMIKEKPRVLQGQQVRLVAQSAGLQLSAEGIALQNGKVGQQIPVRNSKSGLVIRAVVQESGECQVFF